MRGRIANKLPRWIIIEAAFLLVAFNGIAFADNNRQGAIGLNNTGYQYYEAKDFKNAAEYFRKAIQSDDTYLYPHYNLACTISLMLGLDNRITNLDQYQREALIGESVNNLQKTLRLNPEYKSKMQNDPDLEYLRTRADYYILLNYSLDSVRDVQSILSGIASWGLPEPLDSERYRSRLRFISKGRLEISNFYWEGNTYNYTMITTGSYVIEKKEGGVVILITFEKEKYGKSKFTAKIKQERGRYSLTVEGITTEKAFIGVPFVSNLG